MSKIKIIIFLLFIIIILNFSCNSKSEQTIETYLVKRGNFISNVIETGELQAVHSNNITTPNISWRMGNLKITKIIEDGSQVKKGDVLVEFDKSEIQKAIIDARSKLEIAKAELRKALASHQSKIEELKTNIERCKIQERIAELNLKQAEFESEIDQKKLELNLRKSVIDIEKAIQELGNQNKVNQEDINKLELVVFQEQSKLEESEEALERLTLRAMGPGIAILERNWSTDNKFQVDDQPWRGSNLISLPDLDTMQAMIKINEVDIAKVDTLQEVKIRLDAIPDSIFSGFISEVAVLAKNKKHDSKVKVFEVIARLTEKDSTLMPGMSVSCEIIVNQIKDTLFIPLEALFKEDNGNVVYIKNGSQYEQQPIITGLENDDYVIVTEGLQGGEEIALIDPTIFRAMKKN